MKLLLFEFKKMIRTKTVLYFMLLSVIFIVAIFLRNVVQQDMIPLKKAAYFWDFATDVSMQNNTDRRMLEKVEDEALEEKLVVGQQLHGLLRDLIQAIEDGEWESELTLENDVYETAMVYQARNGQFSLGQLDMEDTMKINEALQQANLAKEDMDLSIQQAVFMKKIHALLFGPIGFLLLLFVTGSVITREFEENNTRFIYTLPIQKWKYIFVKFGSVFVVGLLWIGLITGLSYVLPLFTQQPDGNVFAYPLLTATGTVIHTGQYLLHSILLAGGFLLFAVSLFVFIGYFLRRTILTYVTMFILLIGGWLLTLNGFTHVVNPFLYQQVDKVLISYPQHFPIALAVLVAGSLIFLWMTMSSNRKRGI